MVRIRADLWLQIDRYRSRSCRYWKNLAAYPSLAFTQTSVPSPSDLCQSARLIWIVILASSAEPKAGSRTSDLCTGERA